MKKYLVIGNPVEHSLSPILHNYWFKQNNIDALYEKKKLPEQDLKNIITDVRSDKISGINVTIPFKKSIIPFLDKLSTEAKGTQSVNTIFKINNEICGYNTDVRGFDYSLNQLNFKTKGKKAFILGAGGVTSSIIWALEGLEISKIFVSNRTKQKAEELKKLFPKIEILDWGRKPLEFDMVVNTTSIGLKDNEKIGLDFSDCKEKLFYDVIYSPSQTKFLLEAGKNFKNEKKNGLGMFIYQAQETFKLWHGFSPKVDEKIYTMLQK
jgi:shikimate dehydrogenase